MRLQTRTLASACLIALSVADGADAQSTMIAGWDFSQYFGSNSLAVTSPNNEYSTFCNYSDLDLSSPFPGLGAGATDFGTLYYDGSFGSTDTSGIGSGLEFAPLTGELTSNMDAPGVGTEMSTAGSHNVLTSEAGSPQLFGNALRMVANSSVDVVFEADRTGETTAGNLWTLSFGGQALSTPGSVSVEFSGDGSGYASAGSVLVDTTDTRYEVTLFEDPTEIGYVRLGLVGGVTIDNVAISVPEPLATAGSIAALLSLVAITRERQRKGR